MQAFFPQLAQFQMHSFERMVEKLGCNTPENPEFWIEEKLDGERLLLHMMKDDDDRKYPGGYRLGFWSRKGKDYAYLYGDSFEDKSSALSQHIKDAFDTGVENIILDGEMITWDPVSNTMVGFGTLKTAALSEKADPFDGTGVRPLFRVFDCLYLNGQDLTSFKLIDRRKALERCITDVEKRIEKHKYLRTSKVDDIDKELRRIVEEGSEGLVLKNPHSIYQLNHRSYDWIKVKPEYMTEYGESLDCLVIGAYFGQGHRGGGHASFLCGLRVDENHVNAGNHLKFPNNDLAADINAGANPMQCYSFFKVGGGFKATDYARIKHLTQGKWHDWDKSKPPTEYIKLGGGDRQFERPDQWIKPCDSFIVDVKAASVGPSDQFVSASLHPRRFCCVYSRPKC
jgi:DNA ligase-4